MEYFRMASILNPFSENETLSDYQRALKEYEKNGKISPLRLDNELKITEQPGNYLLALEKDYQLMPGIRQRSYRENPDFIQRLGIEVTTVCNSKCNMCSRQKKKRSDIHLSFDDFKKIIDQTNGHKLVDLYLYRLGEPFLNPELSRMLQYLKNFNNFEYIWISSNGLEFSSESMQTLLDSNVTIFNMSINAVDQEGYNVMNGIENSKEAFLKVKENFVNAAKIKKQSGKRTPFLRAQMISHESNFGREEEFLNQWGQYADILNIGILEFGSTIEFNEATSKKREKRQEDCQCRKPGTYHFYLYNDGSVVPCMEDYNAEFLKIGDWKEQSINEIFNNKKYKEFLKMHLEGNRSKIPFCSECQDYNF